MTNILFPDKLKSTTFLIKIITPCTALVSSSKELPPMDFAAVECAGTH